MDPSLKEYFQKKLGTKLNRDKVKLWEPPYTEKDGSKGDVPQVKIAYTPPIKNVIRVYDGN